MKIIAGKHARRYLATHKGENLRPSSAKLRETLFNICQHEILNMRFLDLFAGAGAVGLEALSRGALHATFVDADPKAKLTIKKNLSHLGEESASTILCLPVLKALKMFHEQGRVFDIIFADPPYGKGLSDEVLAYFDEHALLADEGVLFLEDVYHQGDPCFTPKNLYLKSSRKIGKALLREYRNL